MEKLEDILEQGSFDAFEDYDSEINKIEQVREIQGHQKMFQFINSGVSVDTLKTHIETCLKYGNVNAGAEQTRYTKKVNNLKPIQGIFADVDFI